MQVTAAEYTRLYLSALQDTLDRFPPPQPSEAAVNLLVTVGQQQEFLLWHSLLPPPGHPGSLDALEVSPIWSLTALQRAMGISIQCLLPATARLSVDCQRAAIPASTC